MTFIGNKSCNDAQPNVSSSSLPTDKSPQVGLLLSVFIVFQEDEVFDHLTDKVIYLRGQKLLMPEAKAVFTDKSDAEIYAKQFNCVVQELPLNKYTPKTWPTGQRGFKMHVRGPENNVAVFDCYGPPEPSMAEWRVDPLEPLSAIVQTWARDEEHAREIGLLKAVAIRERCGMRSKKDL